MLSFMRSLVYYTTLRNRFSSTILNRNGNTVTQFKDLPTAKKFLGIINLGVLKSPISKFHVLLQKKNKQLGDMYTFQPFFFSPKMVVVSRPDLISELFAKEGKYPSRGSFGRYFKKAKDVVGLKEGVVLANGTEWLRNREPLSKRLLRPKFLSSYFPKLSEIARGAVKDIIEINQRQKHDFAPIIDRLCLWTLNTADYLSFHQLTETKMSEELAKYFKAMMCIIESTSEVNDSDLIRLFSNKKHNELVEAIRTVVVHIKKQIQFVNNTPKDPNEEHISMFEYLQNETDFQDLEIIETLIALLGAGIDATVKTTQWFWYNLSKHPNVQDKLHDELHYVIRDSPVITAEHYNRLHYMKMCMKESMRLTPSVSAHFRLLPEDSTIGGVDLPKNTQLIADVYSVSLDERFWDNPLEFKPERWENRKDVDPFSYIPFGIGPRMCVGRRIAEAEMQLLTAHLCMSYKIHLDKEPDAKFGTVINPSGLNLSFEERQ